MRAEWSDMPVVPATVSALDETTSTETQLASVLRIGITRLRRRLAAERDVNNPLSLGAMAVLGALDSNGMMTVGGLAAAERVQPPSMTRIVSSLADGGYVSRSLSEHDRRQVLVALTPLGAAVVQGDRARRDEWLAGRLSQLSAAELEVLRATVPIFDRMARA